MKRTLCFLIGYLAGGSLFFILIPYAFFQLSRLDYLLDYRMIISSMALRFAVTGVLLLIGVVFVIWSNILLFTIGKGGPADGFGVTISPRTQKLVIRGPYRYCRHPMVFGALTVYLSETIYLNSFMGLIALVILLSGVVLYLKNSEEKRLIKDFGAEYLAYKMKVPMIIPGRRRL